MRKKEVVHAIAQLEGEDMQAVLDAVVLRHSQLFPRHSLLLLSLPKDDPVERNRQLAAAWELLAVTEE